MQLKDVLIGLAVPALVSAAAIPQDIEIPEFPEGEDIVGGEVAAAGAWPFLVALQRGQTSQFCGGTLLNANTVVTAAHCSVGQTASAVTIRAGTNTRGSGGSVFKVSSIKVHPNYNADTFDNDVAIWKLASSVPTSSTIKFATLTSAGNDPASGSSVTVAGWGDTREGANTGSTALRQVTMPVIARSTCASNYSPTYTVTKNMFCAGLAAGGKDSCQGDSGGPIVDANKNLIGIVSWGDGCARAGAPGVYSNVGSLSSFITSNL